MLSDPSCKYLDPYPLFTVHGYLWCRTANLWLRAHCCDFLFHQDGLCLKVFPGEEFRVAFVEAQKLRARVILGDRPVRGIDMVVFNESMCLEF